MYKTLLVNKIDPQDFTGTKKRIFFLLGDMINPAKELKLIEVINKLEFLDIHSTVYKYNGVELSIDVQKIPEVVKLLAKEDFLIYSIYEIYTPDL
ncbi:hypothetical protein E9840_07240 [Tissierella creatinini]|nr:hypothetical protein E9840_07240 [Tissierella creatinini]TJX66037.1 hypothetical protein E8P77_09095 [Soehngenia saccharolytica]